MNTSKLLHKNESRNKTKNAINYINMSVTFVTLPNVKLKTVIGIKGEGTTVISSEP